LLLDRDWSSDVCSSDLVVVNDYGPVGATKTASVRGSTSDQVLVLLDGVRLNSSRDGSVDLSTIPVEIIDHIEVVRGGESALYGSSAIGGVINIITKKAQKPSLSVSVTNGSYIPHAANTVSSAFALTPVAADPLDLLDSQDVTLSLEGTLGKTGLMAGGSFVRAANGFTWDDTTAIDAWRRRTNADTLSGNGYVGVNAPLLGGALSAKGIFEMAGTGAPGSLSFVSETARQSDAAASASMDWKTSRFFTDALSFDVKAFYRYDQLGYDDPSYPPASLHTTQTGSFDVTQKWTVSDQLAAIYGGSASYDSAVSTNFAAPAQRLSLAGFLSAPFSPVESLTVTPTARYDSYSDFPGSFSFSLSAVLLLGEESSLRASLASAYRVPTMNELYWSDLFDAGNTALKPETSYGGEVGWSLQGSRFSLDTSLFARIVFDEISAIWPFDSTIMKFSPVNISQSILPGAEIHGTFAITDKLSVDASYTFIYSLLLQLAGQSITASDNLRVPFVPLHSIAASIKYRDRGLSLSADAQYVSQKFTDFANTQSAALPGYFLANAGMQVDAGARLAFSLEAKNIFDALYYTQSGYPMPPFSVETGVKVRM
jgi:outer membrane cobalamin receptor